MLELDKVDRAQLAEFVGQDFEIALKGGASVNARLVEVRSLGAARAGSREPFALEFCAGPSVRLPQAYLRGEAWSVGNDGDIPGADRGGFHRGIFRGGVHLACIGHPPVRSKKAEVVALGLVYVKS